MEENYCEKAKKKAGDGIRNSRQISDMQVVTLGFIGPEVVNWYIRIPCII